MSVCWATASSPRWGASGWRLAHRRGCGCGGKVGGGQQKGQLSKAAGWATARRDGQSSGCFCSRVLVETEAGCPALQDSHLSCPGDTPPTPHPRGSRVSAGSSRTARPTHAAPLSPGPASLGGAPRDGGVVVRPTGRGQAVLVWTWALPFSGWVILGKSPALSEHRFLHG